MTYSVTIADVRSAFDRYNRACKHAGLIPDGHHLVLSEGSKLYGNAYRVNLTGDRVEPAVHRPAGPWGPASWSNYPNGSGHANPPEGNDFLGMTKREAYNSLHARACTVEDVTQAQEATR